MAVINRSATERKRGEWLSTAVIEYDRLLGDTPSEQDAELGLLEQMNSRLARIEKQLGFLVAERK